ncbi:hypothetical protein GLOIN_2v1585099 [Rhizophagus clarus]|uniref:Conidiation protein 6 n=1 Tax=Rhizophagus clarus TaxID=94130 RepID=A0A8H3KSV1_9GLOM|nr:hypothetical protein GLOIN_2v1585099 [Rhizophagus clarus]
MSDKQNTAESQAQRIRADTAEARSERSYKAAAHNPSNTEEGRLHAAEKLSELHEQRTGESLDPNYNAKNLKSNSSSRKEGKQGKININNHIKLLTNMVP